MKTALPLIIALLAAPVASAGELTVGQAEAKAKFEKDTADSLAKLNATCGTKVVITSDFENYRADAWAGSDPASYCDGVLYAINAICERPAYKPVMEKQLKSVACLFAGSKPAQPKDGSNDGAMRNMSYKKGTFTFHMLKDVGNVWQVARAVIENALK